MPLINAHGEVFREIEGLLNASQAHAALLPGAEPLRNSLQQTLDQIRTVKAQQEEFEGRRQATTQQLGELIERGREEARRLRGFVRSQLGTKNELLVQFGVAPIRRRSRSAAKPEVEAPPPAVAGPGSSRPSS
jgi:hypothetical protein